MISERPFAIVFDMDGTLLDSERVAWDTFTAACAEFDLEADFEIFRNCVGASGERTREIVRAALGPIADGPAFWDCWLGIYKAQVDGHPIPVKEGVAQVLETVRDLAIPCAVATSTRRAHALERLEIAGLLDYFEFVIGGDEVSESKPHPEIYATAVNRLGGTPRACLAVEDSGTGLRSAHSAGLTTIHVPDLAPVPEDILAALSPIILPSLSHLAEHLQAMDPSGVIEGRDH